ncbi:DUF4367 domain-containing protein [Oscillibacter valericigenes]|nr:DUF4367 domain-containing protein [Oscillibacter valericigenes]
MPQIRHNSAADGANENTKLIQEHLRNQSKDDLLDDLSDWLSNVDGTHFDQDYLNALLSALDEIAPTEDTFSPESSLTAFHQRFEPVFEQEESCPATQPVSPHSRRSFRTLIQLVAIITVMLFSMVTAQAFGFDIFGAIARWTSSTFHFSTEETTFATIGKYPIAEGEQKSYDSLQAALDDFNISGEVAPTWIPERFELKTVTATVISSKICLKADYIARDNSFISIRFKSYVSSVQTQVEKDAEQATLYYANGLEYYLISDKSFEKATWINGQLECLVYGSISQQELKEIINSIYEG